MTHTAESAVPPGPRGYPFIGTLPALRKDPLRFLLDAARAYPETSVVRLGARQWGPKWFLLTKPEVIRHVMQDRWENYQRGVNTRSARLLMGNGLNLNEGESWTRQRQLIQPAFHTRQIQGFAATMTDIMTALLDQWSDEEANKPFDIVPVMLNFTQQILLKTIFGFTAATSVAFDSIAAALATAIEYVDLLRSIPLPLWVPTARNRAFRNALKVLNSVVYEIIAERRQRVSDNNNLLSILLNARDEHGGMTDTQVRDETMTFFVTGHETLAMSLSWVWYLLAQHPEVEARLHVELDQVLDGRTPVVDDLPKLTYTRMVFEEALRLYPPAWLVPRSPVAADVVGGYAIPAKAVLLISPYMMHRHPAYWENPERFDPGRFAPGRPLPRFIYLPFGVGPHVCIGSHFALMEAQLLIAMVAQRFHLKLQTCDVIVQPEVAAILRPPTIMMTYSPRTRAPN